MQYVGTEKKTESKTYIKSWKTGQTRFERANMKCDQRLLGTGRKRIRKVFGRKEMYQGVRITFLNVD